MKNNFLVDKSNNVIKLSDLKNKVPSTVYTSYLHDDICYYIAKRKINNYESLDFKLYVNLLLLKSEKTRELTSLVHLITRNLIDVTKINCNYVEKDFFFNFLEFYTNINYEVNFNYYNLIDSRYKYIIFPAKILLHKFYRFLRSKVIYKKKFIKTYVEDTLVFYPKEMQDSTIFIYPFNLNFKRQKKFINYCKENHLGSYSLMGLPYKLINYIFSLLFKKDTDISVMNVEKNSYLLHSEELLGFGIKELYTLDEFETASFVLNSNLINNDVFVMNKTHGVGGYCLFLAYSNLEVYTSKQYIRYKKWNPNVNISFQGINLTNAQEKKDKKIKVVFIHGNMVACGLNYEEELESNIINMLNNTCKELNLQFFIKFHPNTSDKAKDKYNNLNIKELKKIDDLVNPLFITIFSTAFYDFLKYGPFLFFTDDFLNPSDIFGDDIDKFTHFKEMKGELIKYKTYSEYFNLHKSQIKRLNNR